MFPMSAGDTQRQGGTQMLNCSTCEAQVEILAHQIRNATKHSNGEVWTVCLDCADRYYQDELTKRLIAAEKIGA